MIRSLLKGMLFLIVSGFFAFAIIHLVSMPGQLTLNINGSELNISILVAVCVMLAAFIFLLICFALVNLVIAFLRFLTGDETAISRYFTRSREVRGNRALLNALISSYEGDNTQALQHSSKAKNLLKNNPISLLVNAKMAQQTGNTELVLKNFKQLLLDKETKLVALSGIVSEKIKAGDYNSAIKLTKKSIELNPKNTTNINTLFNLQLGECDWKGARQTLQAKKKNDKIPHTIFLRQEASLFFSEAKQKQSQGLTKEALDLVLTAVRQYPSFVAGLSFLTELELISGNKKRTAKLLQKGWALFPHPEIAKSFAELEINETAEARKVRFEVLTKMQDSGPQTKILLAELSLATREFDNAKKVLSELVKADPDNYILSLMAAAEKGAGATDSIVREWLTKAVNAPKTFSWICKNCDFQTDWVCICPKCESFDSMEWRRPPYYANKQLNRTQASNILEKDIMNDSSLDNKLVGFNNEKELEEGQDDKELNRSLGINMVKKAREIN